jgi:hypothetical protein
MDEKLVVSRVESMDNSTVEMRASSKVGLKDKKKVEKREKETDESLGRLKVVHLV